MKTLQWLVMSALAMGYAQAAMLEGSKPKEWPANPAQHVVTMERVINNPADAALITAAESAAPAPAVLLVAVRKQQPNATLVPKQWWHQEAVGVKIPFALTTEAIAYYSELVMGFGKQKLERYMQPSSHFTYNAKVEKHLSFDCDGKTFRDVSVVTLSMDFSEDFASTMTEGLSFSKKRVVVFDAAGKVLHISGDGETETAILAI